jgi:hypothetical protein
MVVSDIDSPSRTYVVDSGGWSYKIIASVSNKSQGMRIHIELNIDGDWTDLTDGIFFSVIVCKCNQKQSSDPLPHHSQAWPGLAPSVDLEKMHIIISHQRQGHGLRVLTALIKWYFESKTGMLTVGAPSVKTFYRRCGFDFARSVGSTQLETDNWEVL